uniref:Transmembrane protein n=1 Tax=Plectus sambesii TaxID=2011161 RepID=A0A914WX84_9BILA
MSEGGRASSPSVLMPLLAASAASSNQTDSLAPSPASESASNLVPAAAFCSRSHTSALTVSENTNTAESQTDCGGECVVFPDKEHKMETSTGGGRTPRRKWTALPGRNKFLCNGRIMMSHQSGVFYFTLALVVGTMALFFGFDAYYLWTELSPAIPLVAGVLLLLV